MVTGKGRRTLAKVGLTPTPKELYNKLIESEGWPYKTNKEFFLIRDRALVSLIYNGELRISEALRIQLGQISETKTAIVIENVQLSKVRLKNKGGVIFGSNARTRIVQLPKKGERACFTKLFQDYIELLKEKNTVSTDFIFPWSQKKNRKIVGIYTWRDGKTTTPRISAQMVGTNRAHQIITALLPDLTTHWLRVYGEKYLYKKLGNDIIAVSKIVKVDPRTAIKYLMAGEADYPVY